MGHVSLLQPGHHEYAARVRLGKGEVIDIEREVELSPSTPRGYSFSPACLGHGTLLTIHFRCQQVLFSSTLTAQWRETAHPCRKR